MRLRGFFLNMGDVGMKRGKLTHTAKALQRELNNESQRHMRAWTLLRKEKEKEKMGGDP